MAHYKSYLALVEYENEKHMQFFNSRARVRSQKTIDEADRWMAGVLRKHGTHNVRASISEVLYVITG